MRRPVRASRFAAVALLGVVGAIGLPQTAMAQELDPETLAAELEATVDQDAIDAAIDRAFESGGAVAPPAPAVDAPTSAPEPVVAPEPAPPTPSETATAPAPESQVEQPSSVTPTAPAAPRNINIDIRVLSPGDDGDVNQVIEEIGGGAAPGRSEVVPGGADDPELTMNWVWEWSDSCEDDMRAASAAVEWNWTWQACGAAVPDEDMLRGLMPEMPDDLIPAPELPGEVAGAEEDFVATLNGPSGGPGDHGESQQRRASSIPLLSGVAPASLLTTADAEGGPGPVGSERVRAAHGRRQQSAVRQRAPEQAPPALPSAAASGLSGGGSFAPLGAVLLALLCLMAPRALGLARFPDRRLTSQLSSSRLERPG